MIPRPDTKSALKGLKDFQRKTVDYVFQRFYGADPTRRFLVADEVGLGKTLVARGVIARTIDHLWDELTHDETRRIDVIYICSNADIARQNIDRLKIPGCEEAAQATRLTLLPLQMQDLRPRVNFVALTPATSFEQTGGGGRMDERVLLYWLLDRAWGIHGSRASLYVMQDYARTAPFERGLEAFDFGKLNEQIADGVCFRPGQAGAGRDSRRRSRICARASRSCAAYSAAATPCRRTARPSCGRGGSAS